MLNKIIIKSLLKTRILLIAVFFLFATAISLLVVTNTAYDNIEASFEQYQIESNFEDFQFPIVTKLEDKYTDEWINDFEKHFDVYLEQKRENTITYDDTIYAINRYNSNDILNTIELKEGELPTEEGQVIITTKYADSKKLSIGDELTINSVKYTISGIGYFPEYTFPVNTYDGNFSLGDNSFTAIFMNDNSYDKLDNTKEIIHYSGKFNHPENYDVDVKSALNPAYKEMVDYEFFQIPYTDAYGEPQVDENGNVITREVSKVIAVIPEKLNPGLSSIEEEIQGEKRMFNMLSTIIVFITVLVTVVLFNNIFDSQKREIGILKAEGISVRELSIGFASVLFVVLLLASFAGFIGGYFLKEQIYILISTLFSLPITVVAKGIYVNALISVLSVDFVVIAIVFVISIYRKIRIKPLILIKNIVSEKPPKYKFEFITKRLSFKNKYKINIALRNIGTSILLIFGLLVSSFLLLMGTTMQASVNQAIDNMYGGIFTYSYRVQYSDGVLDPEYDENSIITVDNIDLLSVTKPDGEKKELKSIVDPEENVTTTIIAFDTRNNKYINLYSEETGNKNSNLYNDGVVLPSKLSTRYDIEVGDKIEISDPYNNDDTMMFTVNDIVTDEISSNIYFDINQYQEKFNLSAEYANGEVGYGEKKFDVLLYDQEAIYQETTTLEENLRNTAQIMLIFMRMITIIASIISLVTLTVIVMLVIKKSRKTISVMKVLGYTNNEITSMTTSVYKYIIFFAYILAIPLFRGLIQIIVNMALSESDIAVRVKIPFSAVLMGLVVVYIVYFIAMRLAKHNINKISLAESLKVDE